MKGLLPFPVAITAAIPTSISSALPAVTPVDSVLPESQRWQSQSPADTTATTSTAIAERFVDLVAEHNFAAAHQMLHPDLQSGWTVSAMQEDWEYLQRVTGAYQRRLGVDEITPDLVLVNTQFERVTDDLFIILDDQQRIIGVDFPLQLPRMMN